MHVCKFSCLILVVRLAIFNEQSKNPEFFEGGKNRIMKLVQT